MSPRSFGVAILLLAACAGESPSGSDSGGTSGSASGSGGATAGTGGGAAVGAGGGGGTGSGATGTGAAGQAGNGGTSGAAAGTGGAGNGGTAGTGGASGSGGVGAAGSAGSGGGTGGAGGGQVAVPSSGCGEGGRPPGGVLTVEGSHIYSFPPSYDGTTPMPLIMAFHAAGNENTQLRNITQGSALEEHFVMAFPRSEGNGWNPNADGQSVTARYDELLQSYCIDTSRVFATGHSSGAQLIVQFMCAGDTRFRAIAPVASSVYCQSWDPIPALVIHGANDQERQNTSQDADGRKDLAPYLASNDCDMTTAAYEQAGCMSGATQVDPGCVQYQGCSELTVWCQHNDPQYSNTNHGWPCFANDAMDEFFLGLP